MNCNFRQTVSDIPKDAKHVSIKDERVLVEKHNGEILPLPILEAVELEEEILSSITFLIENAHTIIHSLSNGKGHICLQAGNEGDVRGIHAMVVLIADDKMSVDFLTDISCKIFRGNSTYIVDKEVVYILSDCKVSSAHLNRHVLKSKEVVLAENNGVLFATSGGLPFCATYNLSKPPETLFPMEPRLTDPTLEGQKAPRIVHSRRAALEFGYAALLHPSS